MKFCRKCGAELPGDALFCSKCGMAVSAAPPPPPPAASAPRSTANAASKQERRGAWWIAPAAVVGLVILAWLLLVGLPVRREEAASRATTASTETIAEAEPQPQQSSTLIEVPAGTADDSFEISTTTVAAPPMAPAPTATAPTATALPPMTSATTGSAPVQRPPVIVTQPGPSSQPAPRPQPQPAPVRVVPPPSRAGEITANEAAVRLRDFVRSTRYYPVASECLRVESRGYRNEGYNMEVWHSCSGGGSSRLLGRWRVDAKTRELFRQRDDGRYLRP
jgi:hypothetical protein